MVALQYTADCMINMTCYCDSTQVLCSLHRGRQPERGSCQCCTLALQMLESSVHAAYAAVLAIWISMRSHAQACVSLLSGVCLDPYSPLIPVVCAASCRHLKLWLREDQACVGRCCPDSPFDLTILRPVLPA